MKVTIEVDGSREARVIGGISPREQVRGISRAESVSNVERVGPKSWILEEIEIMDLGFVRGESSFWVNTVSLLDPITEGAFPLSSAFSSRAD